MSRPPADLMSCDNEPIHTPGGIQPHGAMLACDAAGDTVSCASVNARALLGLDRDPVGQTLDAVLGAAAADELRAMLAAPDDGRRLKLRFGVALPPGRFDVALHCHDDRAILEFEPAGDDLGRRMDAAGALLDRLTTFETSAALIAAGAGLIRDLTGYDRVMIYALGPDGAGQVLAEARAPDADSYLGQYFPATDIPRQARALYRLNPIRQIADARVEPVPLRAGPGFGVRPLDLSHAHLRAVSPVHCEYLRNMGVTASMSISVIVGGELWGLVTCHDPAPRALGMAERAVAELAGDVFGLQLDALLRQEALAAAGRARVALQQLMARVATVTDVGEALRGGLDGLAQLIPCDGVGLWRRGTWTGVGLCPPREAVAPLIALVDAQPEGRIWDSRHLAAALPGAEALTDVAAGALCVPLTHRPRDCLVFLRQPVEQTLDWAGDPETARVPPAPGDRLSPRRSFALWRKTVRDKSHPWTADDRQIAAAIRLALVEIVLKNNDLLSEERARAAIRQRLQSEDLNLRVRALLAVIGSLTAARLSPVDAMLDQVEGLRDRIQTLTAARDHVAAGDGGGPLAQLLETEMTPFLTGGSVPAMTGPVVWLEAPAQLAMALAVQQKTGQSARHGALAGRGGQMRVNWSVDRDGTCVVDWFDDSPGAAEGFDPAGVDQVLGQAGGGVARIGRDQGGLRLELAIPGRLVRQADPTTGAATSPGVPARLKRVLIVEDQALIAMALEMALQDEGLDPVGTATDVAGALRLIETLVPDVAVLDFDLGQHNSVPVAEALTARGIPFVFATGYGADLGLGTRFADVPVVDKPYDVNDILLAFGRLA